MRKLFILILLSGFLIGSCTESINDSPIGNQAPNTSVSIFPDSNAVINQQKSRLRLHWWGDDPDGLVAGYYFKWEGVADNWIFTTSNDSLFSLPIGSADTTYSFKVAAADDQGNGRYDSSVMIGDENVGTEPFIDKNANGVWDTGEFYYDIGLVDPTPASQAYPIKNTPPEILWSELSVLPDKSLPVMTIGWSASDLDGDESITHFNLALNDTTQTIAVDGYARIITIRYKEDSGDSPKMEVLVNGDESRIADDLLTGLQLDANNRIYLQAVDISGATSNFIALPDSGRNWFVTAPKGKLLIVDDYQNEANVQTFYDNLFSGIQSGGLAGKFNSLDLEADKLPYENITLYETLKLFKYVFWYSDNTPSLETISLNSSKFIQAGGKIAYSFSAVDSSASFEYNLASLQSFLPIDSYLRTSERFLFAGANVVALGGLDYPSLQTNGTISSVRTFTANANSSFKIYNLNSSTISGTIAFMDNAKKLFFIGLPLHLCNATDGSVSQLLEKVFFEDFGLTP